MAPVRKAIDTLDDPFVMGTREDVDPLSATEDEREEDAAQAIPSDAGEESQESASNLSRSSERSDTPARARPTGIAGKRHALTEMRIAEICRMMRECTFETGKTAKMLAARWHLSEQRIACLTAEASKIVRAEIDADSVRLEAGSFLRATMREAKSVGDRKNLIQAARALIELAGAAAPTRIHATAVPLEKLSEEERNALIAEAISTLDPSKLPP
jgi:hypothetical protein